MQLTAHLLGGNVKKGEKGEYGKATLEITKSNPLFTGVSRFSTVWMSHFDEVETLPENFEISAKSGVIAGIFNEKKNIYCVQFHPEVSHSEFGARMLENFVFQICKAEKNWKLTIEFQLLHLLSFYPSNIFNKLSVYNAKPRELIPSVSYIPPLHKTKLPN